MEERHTTTEGQRMKVKVKADDEVGWMEWVEVLSTDGELIQVRFQVRTDVA